MDTFLILFFGALIYTLIGGWEERGFFCTLWRHLFNVVIIYVILHFVIKYW